MVPVERQQNPGPVADVTVRGIELDGEVGEIFNWIARFGQVGITTAQLIARLELAYYAHVNEVPDGQDEQGSSQT